MEAPEERVAQTQDEKSSIYSCSRCGALLLRTAVAGHSCYRQALLRHGQAEARLLIRRVPSKTDSLQIARDRDPVSSAAIPSSRTLKVAEPRLERRTIYLDLDDVEPEKTTKTMSFASRKVAEPLHVRKRSRSPSPVAFNAKRARYSEADQIPAAVMNEQGLAEAQEALMFDDLKEFCTFHFPGNPTFPLRVIP